MLGTVEDILSQIRTGSPLCKGLSLLHGYREGRLPELAAIVQGQEDGDKAQLAIAGMTVLIQCYLPKPREQGRFEAHQCHTDLQYLCEGEEWIEVCDLSKQANLPPYDDKGNIYFPLPAVSPTRLHLSADQVAVLFPKDAHAPCLRVDWSTDAVVRKIVIKVQDAHLP